jgi:hypothetical protein
MIKCTTTEPLQNSNGIIEPLEICDLLKCWLNISSNDIYVEIQSNASNIKMITSVSKILIINQGNTNYNIL